MLGQQWSLQAFHHTSFSRLCRGVGVVIFGFLFLWSHLVMPSFVLEMLLCWKKCFGGNKKQWGDMENCFFVSNMVSLEREKFPLLWGERAKLGKPEVLILEEFVWLDFWFHSSSITNILDFLDTLNFCSFFLYLYFCLLPFFFFFFFWGISFVCSLCTGIVPLLTKILMTKPKMPFVYVRASGMGPTH